MQIECAVQFFFALSLTPFYLFCLYGIIEKMNICLFSQDEVERPLDIRDPRAEHILKILHKKEGDSFSAGIIGGMAGTATIRKLDIQEGKSADGRKTFSTGFMSFSFEPKTDGKPLYPLVMIIGFPRPIQLKRLLRDMAGLGVCQVHLTSTELGEKSYLKSDLATSDAGYQMLLEGTVQAAGTHVPELFIHKSLDECLAEIKNSSGSFRGYALDNINPSGNLWDELIKNPPEKQSVSVAAIGSERGWTDSERDMLEKNGFVRLGMGKRILRTETASTVAASLILGAMGVLD